MSKLFGAADFREPVNTLEGRYPPFARVIFKHCLVPPPTVCWLLDMFGELGASGDESLSIEPIDEPLWSPPAEHDCVSGFGFKHGTALGKAILLDEGGEP